ADQVGIGEQAGPVRPLGRCFRVAHTQELPLRRSWSREALDSSPRLNSGSRLRKMTKVTGVGSSGDPVIEPSATHGPRMVRSPDSKERRLNHLHQTLAKRSLRTLSVVTIIRHE